MSEDSVFQGIHIVKIPLWIWILLKFQKSYVSADIVENGSLKHTYATYGKKIFGKLYIVKSEHYVNGKLVSRVKLKRIEEYPYMHGASIRYQSIDELI